MIYNLLNINFLISKWVTSLTKNKKLKKILVYGGLLLALLILIVFFDEIRSQTIHAFKEGQDYFGEN